MPPSGGPVSIKPGAPSFLPLHPVQHRQFQQSIENGERRGEEILFLLLAFGFRLEVQRVEYPILQHIQSFGFQFIE